jgi:hypothetical protein
MKFTLTLTTDNDAFQPEPGDEVARILREVASRVLHDRDCTGNAWSGTVRDINGNACGAWSLRP